MLELVLGLAFNTGGCKEEIRSGAASKSNSGVIVEAHPSHDQACRILKGHGAVALHLHSLNLRLFRLKRMKV